MTAPTAVKTFFILCLAVAAASGVSWAMTEEENKQLQDDMKDYQFKTVTTKEGFNFKIPEDMPIETRNGMTGPIPFEEYLYFKLKKVEEKLLVIDKKIDDLGAVFAATKKQSESQRELSPQEKAGLLSSS